MLFLSSLLVTSSLLIGTKIPSEELDFGFPPSKVNLAERVAGKKVILVPGYLAEATNLKALGIDEIIIYCVNDGAVMDAWAKDQGVDGSDYITMMGDPSGKFTNAVGMVLDHPGPMNVLGYPRCKRFAMYLEDGIIKLVRVSEGGPDGQVDPAGDDYPESTLAPAMIEAIKELTKKDEL